MKVSRIIGLILVVLGAVCLLFARHITEEIMIGEGKIERGQHMVDTMDQFSAPTQYAASQSAYTKPLGKFFSDSTADGKRQLQAGRETVAYYKKVVNNLHISGIILVALGLIVGFFPRKKSS
jgi:uncharacterized membrane protein